MIARTKDNVKTSKLQAKTIPAGTYAAFTSEKGGFAGEELPKLFDLIFDSWLPASEYKLRDDIIIEALHLYVNCEKKTDTMRCRYP